MTLQCIVDGRTQSLAVVEFRRNGGIKVEYNDAIAYITVPTLNMLIKHPEINLITKHISFTPDGTEYLFLE